MRVLVGLSGLLLVTGLVAAPGATAAPAAPAGQDAPAAAALTQTDHAVGAVGKRVRAKRLLSRLPRKKEKPAGYARTKFRHWVDADGDCQDTRAEVLAAESLVTAQGGCRITTGRWHSAYDGQVFTDASRLDVDHLVPLAEAWRSGAKKWSKGTRKRFANDLGYGPSLIAVSASTNRSKGDREPQDWMPPNAGHHCVYVASWIAVKWRWQLAADKAERRFLRQAATRCGNPAFERPAKAKVKAQKVKKKARKSSTPHPGGTDPRFSYCYEVIAAGYGPYRRGTDPEYHWYRDADGDGVVCER